MGRQAENLMLFRVTASWMARYCCSLPAGAFIFCVLISFIKDFEQSTATHCRVPNYLPSISAAIGGFTPQRYIWRICISLHAAPRLLVPIVYFNYYNSFYSVRSNPLMKMVALVSSLLHLMENSCLITLTYISSTENHSIHESSFIAFVVFSQLYMMCTIFLFKKVHRGKDLTERYDRSYRYKLRLFLFNFSTLMLAGYLYYRHNKYCEPGVYTYFALCEYMIVLSNIAFHATAAIDFEGDALEIEHKPPCGLKAR